MTENLFELTRRIEENEKYSTSGVVEENENGLIIGVGENNFERIKGIEILLGKQLNDGLTLIQFYQSEMGETEPIFHFLHKIHSASLDKRYSGEWGVCRSQEVGLLKTQIVSHFQPLSWAFDVNDWHQKLNEIKPEYFDKVFGRWIQQSVTRIGKSTLTKAYNRNEPLPIVSEEFEKARDYFL